MKLLITLLCVNMSTTFQKTNTSLIDQSEVIKQKPTSTNNDTIIVTLTLTAAIVTKYYWENASSVIASSREHLYAHQNAGRAATHGGLARRFMGLVCERSADRIPG